MKDAKGRGLTMMTLCGLPQSGELHGRKVMLYALWDHCSIIYGKFLNHHQIYTLNSCNVFMNILENSLHLPVGKTLIMWVHIQQESCRKNIGFRLVCSTPSTIFTRPCTKCFPSFLFVTKCSEGPRRSSENLCRKLLSLNFTWEKSINYLARGDSK